MEIHAEGIGFSHVVGFKDVKNTNDKGILSSAILLILRSGNFRRLWVILPLSLASCGESDGSFYNIL